MFRSSVADADCTPFTQQVLRKLSLAMLWRDLKLNRLPNKKT